MAKKKDTEEKKTKAASTKTTITRKKTEKVASNKAENKESKVKASPKTETVKAATKTETVKASPIKKTIKTEKPKTVKEIVSIDKVEPKQDIKVETPAQKPVDVKDEIKVPTHIGGVKLSDRLINLLKRQAEKK